MKNLGTIAIYLLVLCHVLLIASTQLIGDSARNFFLVLAFVNYVVAMLLMYVNYKELKNG
jgi:uncharacterized membrane protein